ncbi:DEAD/DEAH box helicase [Kribbella amoyensis]|uniref:DEAD/DEAH box helicase n=1 Tax=Kribbella amoyensis TaxID=996641 RepID=UPI0011A2E40B
MTLPVALMGTDLIGQARTGTGKTLGFGIPLLQRTISPGEADYEELAAPGKPQALVVTPTRELTIQVAKDLTTASTVRTVRVLTIYGGVAYEPQLDALKTGVDVVVGTPGRLLDLANRGVLDLSHIKVLVLDEADEMLDLGFLPDVERILRKTPELRQTMLFSATMPSAVIGLARTHMRHPLNIRAESHQDTQMVPTTAQFVYRAHDLDKPEVVARILQAEDRGRVMIFCRTKREASRLTDDLQDRGFKAAAIHGDLNQQARERALTRFRGDKIDVLVCTDVAARGIDVEGVTHVINNTCPEDEKTYIHRIGRTGRAGASGIAVTFVDWPDVIRWKTINKALDLPYDEPQEIYSTSPELYHDLGIPTEAKGRIKPVKPVREEKPERTPRRSEDESGERGPRKRRNRNRRRTRGGQAIDETQQKSESDVTAKTEVPPTAESSTEAAEARTERKPRQRTRRRRGADRAESQESLSPQPTDDAGTAVADPADGGAAVVDGRAAVVDGGDAEVAEVAEVAEKKPARRTRTRKTAASTEAPAEAVEAAPVAEVTEAVADAEQKPARRTRTRKAAAKAEAPVAAEASTEVATDATAEKPAKRTRTRKTAEPTTEVPAEAVAEAPVEEKPAKRTRTRKTAEPTEAVAEATAEVEKPAKRATRKKAVAASAEAPAEEKPAKRTRTRKSTEAPAEAPSAEVEAPAAPAKRTRARKSAEAPAAPEAGAAPTMPTFTAPQ